MKTKLFLNAALSSILLLGLSALALGAQEALTEHGEGFDSSQSASSQKEQITQPTRKQIAEFRAGNCKAFSDFIGEPTILVSVYEREIKVIEKKPGAPSTISYSIAFARVVCSTCAALKTGDIVAFTEGWEGLTPESLYHIAHPRGELYYLIDSKVAYKDEKINVNYLLEGQRPVLVRGDYYCAEVYNGKE